MFLLHMSHYIFDPSTSVPTITSPIAAMRNETAIRAETIPFLAIHPFQLCCNISPVLRPDNFEKPFPSFLRQCFPA